MPKKGGTRGSGPDTGTSQPGKYVSDKAKIKPGSGLGGPVAPGGPGPATSKGKVGKK